MNWKNDHHFSHVQATCPLSWALTNKFEKNFSCNLGNMWMHLMLEEYLNVQHVSNDLFLYLAISISSSLERPWLAPVAGNFLSGSCLTYQLFSFFVLDNLFAERCNLAIRGRGALDFWSNPLTQTNPAKCCFTTVSMYNMVEE